MDMRGFKEETISEAIKRHCEGSKCCIKIRSRKIGISSKEWFEARVPTFEEHPCECVGKESVCFGNEGGGSGCGK